MGQATAVVKREHAVFQPENPARIVRLQVTLTINLDDPDYTDKSVGEFIDRARTGEMFVNAVKGYATVMAKDVKVLPCYYKG